MKESPPEIRMIPVNAINVLNPRDRNERVFKELVESIAHLGLKKPITVSRRGDSSGFDLVFGQGRLEAFVALRQAEIPAVVLNVAQEDCFIMSLVEKLARLQVLAVRRIIERHEEIGKTVHSKAKGRKVTADALIRSYRKKAERQKHVVKKAALAQDRLLLS